MELVVKTDKFRDKVEMASVCHVTVLFSDEILVKENELSVEKAGINHAVDAVKELTAVDKYWIGGA